MRRAWALLLLALLFGRELVLGAVSVARLAAHPRMSARLRPAFVVYPLTLVRDRDITLLANLISLTPGTLSVDVSEDRRELLIHVLDLPDREGLVGGIAGGFETRILEAFR